jgi:hypothetical protein
MSSGTKIDIVHMWKIVDYVVRPTNVREIAIRNETRNETRNPSVKLGLSGARHILHAVLLQHPADMCVVIIIPHDFAKYLCIV